MVARMGERTEYTPGSFCWTDLSTTDQEGAKTFYSGLFGWEADDLPVGDGAVYSMQKMDGKDVAAIAEQPQQQREAGVPPLWNSYVSVESADDAARRAGELGATVHAPPFDVLEVGRMAVIQDPQGAFFMVWQPRQHFGASLVNAPGALSWNELQTPDMNAAASFYSDLFGWEPRPFEGVEDYLVLMNHGRANGGIRPLDPPGMPPNWLVYFATSDLDDSLAKVESLGGTKLAGPIDINIAKVGVVQDPQGAVFALYDGQLEE
jgi:uncharacterized protein